MTGTPAMEDSHTDPGTASSYSWMVADVNPRGEQSHPHVPNDMVTQPDVVFSLRDQTGRSKRQGSQVDVRPHLDRLTIPVTSVRLPESPSSCTDSPCESVFPLYPAPMKNPSRALLRARNVIVFGESGVGKSSIINMIAGQHITQTSNDAVGCTFRCQRYHVLVDDLDINLWDTVGLDEGTEGTVPAKQAENDLKAFLRQITRWDGIDLLLYCIRGTRVRRALLRNYNIFYAAICRKKVPVALVVTGLENYEGDMDIWWTEHEKDLMKHGMRFDAHACVTTLCSDHPAIQDRLKQSREVLRNLVQAKFDTATWKADEGPLMSASLPDARALLRTSEKRAVPLVLICDATEQPNQIHLFPATVGSRSSCVGEREYNCLYVDARELLGGSKFCAETAQRPDLLIFFADADSELDRTWTAFKKFYVLFGGDMCPIIIVFGGLDNHEAAAEMWKLLSSSHAGNIIAYPTYYPGLGRPREMVERADQALTALVHEKCLMKFEVKLTRFQKLCRHSKILFMGRV